MLPSTAVRKIPVHLLVHDPEGAIKLATTRVRVACTPDSGMPESASTLAMRKVITCPLCLETDDFKELEEVMDSTSKADRAAAKHKLAKADKAAEAVEPENQVEDKPTA